MTASEPILRRMKWETRTETSNRVVREADNKIRVNSSRAAASRIGASKAADNKAAKRVASKTAVTVDLEGAEICFPAPFFYVSESAQMRREKDYVVR